MYCPYYFLNYTSTTPKKISLPAPTVLLYTQKSNFALKKNSVRKTEILLVQISGIFWFLETKVGFQGKKNSVYRN
jgi:hypothetical protein